MQVKVDFNLCQNHGLCAIAAPQTFEINDEGRLVYEQNPDSSDRADIESAADGCPEQAIQILD